MCETSKQLVVNVQIIQLIEFNLHVLSTTVAPQTRRRGADGGTVRCHIRGLSSETKYESKKMRCT